MRTALFCVITQPVVAISYRRFGTTYLSHLQESRIKRKDVYWAQRFFAVVKLTALHILSQINPINTITPISYTHNIAFSITITPICPTLFPLGSGTKVCKFIPSVSSIPSVLHSQPFVHGLTAEYQCDTRCPSAVPRYAVWCAPQPIHWVLRVKRPERDSGNSRS
jgi:hypothetical protein